jgi:hypothetical protein
MQITKCMFDKDYELHLTVACCAHASSSADGELVSTSLHFPVQQLKRLKFIINLSAVACYDSTFTWHLWLRTCDPHGVFIVRDC